MHVFLPIIAFLGPDTLGVMIPIIALLIPIVVVLTKHQQRMAEIIHQGNGNNETNDLRREVADLRSLMQRQSLAIDQLNHTRTSVSDELGLQSRINTDSSGYRP